jgi:serine/threonine-protein kinase RsbW
MATKISTLRVPSDIGVLEQVLSWFDQMQHPGVPTKIWLQCQLAIAEGFTNAVRHAHDGLGSDLQIDVEVSLSDDCIEIRVWDCGPPFDLEGKILAIQQQQVDQHAGGGRGLLILQKICDRLKYVRTGDDRNYLLMAKHF